MVQNICHSVQNLSHMIMTISSQLFDIKTQKLTTQGCEIKKNDFYQ